jgi:hypothetical protein
VTEYSHSHPLPAGRRFEHVHRVDASARADHETLPLGLAHPDMAGAAWAPVPGSPADLRQHAGQLYGEANELEAQARALRARAAGLEALADADEQKPPTEAERVRRLLEGP